MTNKRCPKKKTTKIKHITENNEGLKKYIIRRTDDQKKLKIQNKRKKTKSKKEKKLKPWTSKHP